MANTQILIASNTLGSNTTTFTFSSVPSTYSDLILRVSARLSVEDYINITFNGDSATNYSSTRLWDSGTANSGRYSSNTYFYLYPAMNPNQTANSFSSHEIYIPNYTSTSNKPISVFECSEHNGTSGYQFNTMQAVLYRGSSAISSITVTAATGTILTNSTFWLYGIKNT